MFCNPPFDRFHSRTRAGLLTPGSVGGFSCPPGLQRLTCSRPRSVRGWRPENRGQFRLRRLRGERYGCAFRTLLEMPGATRDTWLQTVRTLGRLCGTRQGLVLKPESNTKYGGKRGLPAAYSLDGLFVPSAKYGKVSPESKDENDQIKR